MAEGKLLKSYDQSGSATTVTIDADRERGTTRLSVVSDHPADVGGAVVAELDPVTTAWIGLTMIEAADVAAGSPQAVDDAIDK